MCPKTDIDPTKASALNVVNIGGVFVVSLIALEHSSLLFIILITWSFLLCKKKVNLQRSHLRHFCKTWLYVELLWFFSEANDNHSMRGKKISLCDREQEREHLFLSVLKFLSFCQVLLCGLSFAVLVAVAEFCWRAQVNIT